MKLPMPKFKRTPKAPEILEQEIAERAARKAAKITANGRARTRLDEARDGLPARSLSVIIVTWSGRAALAAALLIIAAGYWYDLLFYGQQHHDWVVVLGLIAFAIVVRTVATAGDVILHETKPENRRATDPDDGIRAIIGNNKGVRWSLRVMWIACIVACSFATLSFFSAGHEARQTETAGINTTETAIKASKETRIAALEKQKAEAAEARDTAWAAADKTISGIQDETPGISASDNETIRDANQSKDEATSAYNEALKDLNTKIDNINAEQETELKEVVVQRVTAQPFMSVYKFLSRLFGTPEGWAILGAWFFAILFEFLCAKLLSTVFALMKVLKRVAKALEMQEAADEMHARIALERMRSNIELDSIRLKATHAQERAMADIELAQRERLIEKARAQAEALRTGTVWIDPDELLEEEAALKRAEINVRIKELRDQAADILAGKPKAELAPKPIVEPVVEPVVEPIDTPVNDDDAPPKPQVGDPWKGGISAALGASV